MERKKEHQGEIKDPRKSTAEFAEGIKLMKEKTTGRLQSKRMREKTRERSLAKEIMATNCPSREKGQ